MRLTRMCAGAVLLVLAVSVCLVQAAPGDGINVKEWQISPYASLNATYDSNVFLRENDEEDDVSTVLRYGANIARGTEKLGFSAHAWVKHERYSDIDALDHDDFGEETAFDFSTPGGFDVAIRQEFKDVEDVDYFADRIEDFRTYKASIGVSRELTEKTDAALAYIFKKKDYDAGTLFGWDQHHIKGVGSYDVTEKSAAYGSTEVGIQDGEGNEDVGTYYNALFGAKTKWTEKLHASAGIGIVGVASDTDDFAELGFEASLAWLATEKITVTAGAEKYIQPASIARDNYDIVSVFRTDAAYNVLDSVRVTLSGAFYRLDLENRYETTTGAIIDKQEDIFVGAARVDYQAPADFVRLFLEGQATNQDSTEDGIDYTQEMVLAGVHLIY